MPDYKKGCIYKIKHKEDYDDENIYIGSTCNIIRRRSLHKNSCYNEKRPHYNLNVYKYMRDNGGWDNFILIKIHDFPCDFKNELTLEERRNIDLFKPKLNMRIPNQTHGEWYDKNKERIADYKKTYDIINKEKNKEYRDKKIKEKCVCGICGFEGLKMHLKRHQRGLNCIPIKSHHLISYGI